MSILVSMKSKMQVILNDIHQCKNQVLLMQRNDFYSGKCISYPVHPGVIALCKHIHSQELLWADKSAVLNAIPMAMTEIPKGGDAFNFKINLILGAKYGTDNGGLYCHLKGLQPDDSSWFAAEAARHMAAQPFTSPSEVDFFINKQNVCQFVFNVHGVHEKCCICFATNEAGLE